jgi:hypothetical protein
MKLWYSIFIWPFIILYGSLSLAIPTPLHAESQKTLVNLRGDQVLVPVNVPPKKDYVFQRLISVNDRLIVFSLQGSQVRAPGGLRGDLQSHG